MSILEEPWFIMHRRFKLFLDYKHELSKMQGDEDMIPISVRSADFKYIMGNDEFDWVPISEGGMDIGFIIVSKGSVAAKHGVDYYIEESYIEKEYRKQGRMTKAVKEYLAEHKGKYGFVMMKVNNVSHAFWGSIFPDMKVTNSHDSTLVDCRVEV